MLQHRDVHASSGMALSEGQREAVMAAASAPVLVLTGGPGCGKTFATRTIVKLWRAMKKTVRLCAPTGEHACALMPDVHRLLVGLWGQSMQCRCASCCRACIAATGGGGGLPFDNHPPHAGVGHTCGWHASIWYIESSIASHHTYTVLQVCSKGPAQGRQKRR